MKGYSRSAVRWRTFCYIRASEISGAGRLRGHSPGWEWDIHPSVPEGEEHQHGPEVIREVLESGEMPPIQYLLLHPEARLTDEEVKLLIEKLPLATQELILFM